MLGIYLSGMVTMGLAVVAVIFWRSWKETGEVFFVRFCGAFILLAGERVPLAFFDKMKEPGSLVYLFRLLAFLVILHAIFKQTFSRKKDDGGSKRPNLRIVSPTERETGS